MYKRTLPAIFALATALMLFVPSSVTLGKGKLKAPNGFNHMIVYMGTGIFDPNNPNPRPGVHGCVGGFCDGNIFQKDIMGRTDEEILALENEAKKFFIRRYGIDIDDPTFAGRAVFDSFTFHPDIQYRLHLSTDHKVPTEGFIIRDGGFRLEITDPNGIDLGGELAGSRIEQGHMIFFGNYNILVTNTEGKPIDELIIFYRSTTPAVIASDGSMTFSCAMSHALWGEGQGFGTFTFLPRADGTIRANGRNVITFPAASSTIDFPEKPSYFDKPHKSLFPWTSQW